MIEDLVNTDEAAKILEMDPRDVRDCVKRGLLRPAQDLAPPIYAYSFKREDVLILAEIRRKKPEWLNVVAMAQQAAFQSRKTELQLSRLMTVLGVDIPQIDLSAEAVQSTYLRAKLLVEAPNYTMEQVYEWSRILYAMGEEYFDALNAYVKDEDPWRPFMTLANKMLKTGAQGASTRSPEERAAYQYLMMSSHNLRRAAFFYLRRVHGRDASVRLFPETLNDVHHTLSSLASAIYH